jgi:hypothetical protein
VPLLIGEVLGPEHKFQGFQTDTENMLRLRFFHPGEKLLRRIVRTVGIAALQAVENGFFELQGIVVIVFAGDGKVVCVGDGIRASLQRVLRFGDGGFHIVDRVHGSDSDAEGHGGFVLQLCDHLLQAGDEPRAFVVVHLRAAVRNEDRDLV